MHGLKRRVDANSLSLFSQPPFAKPGIVFSTFGKLILREPVVCKRKINGILKRRGGEEKKKSYFKKKKHPSKKKKEKEKALAVKRARAFLRCVFVEHCES